WLTGATAPLAEEALPALARVIGAAICLQIFLPRRISGRQARVDLLRVSGDSTLSRKSKIVRSGACVLEVRFRSDGTDAGKGVACAELADWRTGETAPL